MKELPIRGGVALLDDEDFERIAQRTWRVQRKRSGVSYAVSDERTDTKIVKYLMHREVLKFNFEDGKMIDHIDRNGLNNQKQNLRLTSHVDNLQNHPGHVNKRRSKYKGLHWDGQRNKWRVRFRYNNVVYNLGRFDIEEDAAREYDKMIKSLAREFAYLNFPSE